MRAHIFSACYMAFAVLFFLLSISFLGLLLARFLKFLVTRELTSNSFWVAHPLCDVHGDGWTGGADAGLQAFIGTLCSQRERNVVLGRCSCSSCTFITNSVYQRHLTRLRCTTLCNSLHKKSADASLKDGLWLKLHRAGPILIKCLDIWKIPKKREISACSVFIIAYNEWTGSYSTVVHTPRFHILRPS